VSESESFLDRHWFLLRRLHSLTGIVPIGVFLIIHLTTNSSIVWGESLSGGGVKTFQHEVDFIHSLPGLVLIEIFGLWLPILYHAVFGFIIGFTGRSNVGRYKYADNWRYTLQRWSGYIGFLFIVYHVATLRWKWNLPFSAVFDPQVASSSTAIALRGGSTDDVFAAVLVGAIYLTGVTLLVFHLANGLWTAAITWGVTITESAQRRWAWVCAALGVALMAAGWSAYWGFVTLDIDKARVIEEQLILEQGGVPVNPDAVPEAAFLIDPPTSATPVSSNTSVEN
jgi:succinate dehydrogenase / fumarate reductase, cytochrome b subunit